MDRSACSQPAQPYWQHRSNTRQSRSCLASKSDHPRQVINGTEPARAIHSLLETLQPALIRAGCFFWAACEKNYFSESGVSCRNHWSENRIISVELDRKSTRLNS